MASQLPAAAKAPVPAQLHRGFPPGPMMTSLIPAGNRSSLYRDVPRSARSRSRTSDVMTPSCAARRWNHHGGASCCFMGVRADSVADAGPRKSRSIALAARCRRHGVANLVYPSPRQHDFAKRPIISQMTRGLARLAEWIDPLDDPFTISDTMSRHAEAIAVDDWANSEKPAIRAPFQIRSVTSIVVLRPAE